MSAVDALGPDTDASPDPWIEAARRVKPAKVLKLGMVSGSCTEGIDAARAYLEHSDRRALLRLMWTSVLIIVLAAFTTCCGTRPNLAPGRDLVDQHASAVIITATCILPNGDTFSSPIGSGVIVSPSQILTANHVVDEPIPGACVFFAVDAFGESHMLFLEQHAKAYDVARMGSWSKLPYIPISQGPAPVAGDTVYSVANFPHAFRRHGTVQYFHDDPPGNIKTDIFVERGNSGAALYDHCGRLVGIVTHLVPCGSAMRGWDQTCGGRAASLADIPWAMGYRK